MSDVCGALYSVLRAKFGIHAAGANLVLWCVLMDRATAATESAWNLPYMHAPTCLVCNLRCMLAFDDWSAARARNLLARARLIWDQKALTKAGSWYVRALKLICSRPEPTRWWVGSARSIHPSVAPAAELERKKESSLDKFFVVWKCFVLQLRWATVNIR